MGVLWRTRRTIASRPAKGAIKRHNRLLRLYYPKSIHFSKLSPRVLKQPHRLIVHYPHAPKKVS